MSSDPEISQPLAEKGLDQLADVPIEYVSQSFETTFSDILFSFVAVVTKSCRTENCRLLLLEARGHGNVSELIVVFLLKSSVLEELQP